MSRMPKASGWSVLGKTVLNVMSSNVLRCERPISGGKGRSTISYEQKYKAKENKTHLERMQWSISMLSMNTACLSGSWPAMRYLLLHSLLPMAQLTKTWVFHWLAAGFWSRNLCVWTNSAVWGNLPQQEVGDCNPRDVCHEYPTGSLCNQMMQTLLWRMTDEECWECWW